MKQKQHLWQQIDKVEFELYSKRERCVEGAQATNVGSRSDPFMMLTIPSERFANASCFPTPVAFDLNANVRYIDLHINVYLRQGHVAPGVYLSVC